MPVYWDVKNIANHEVVTTHPNHPDKWHPLTEALVSACNYIGLTEISAKNLDEWLWRLAFMEAVGQGKLLNDWKDDKPIERNYTRAEIESHIGLRTNWGTIPRTKWVANYVRSIKRDADRIVQRKFAKPEPTPPDLYATNAALGQRTGY